MFNFHDSQVFVLTHIIITLSHTSPSHTSSSPLTHITLSHIIITLSHTHFYNTHTHTFADATWTCVSLVEAQGSRVCTDNRMPDYFLTLKCPATCAKANGAKLIEAEPSQGCVDNCDSKVLPLHECTAACTHVPVDCAEWIAQAYTKDGCAVNCPSNIKLQYRPYLVCEYTAAIGDRVQLPSGELGCVTMVLRSFAMVNLDSRTPLKVRTQDLVSLPPDATACNIDSTDVDTQATQPLSNPLSAVISGPELAGASRCDPVILNAYECTSPDSHELKYEWIVPASVTTAVTSGLRDVVLTFDYLPAGNHSFGLEVTDSTGKTARAKDFKMTVLPYPAPVVSLACPEGVCTRTEAGNYEMQVSLFEQTILMLDVTLASECATGSTGSLSRMVWEVQHPKSINATLADPEEYWQPLQVGPCNCSCTRYIQRSDFVSSN